GTIALRIPRLRQGGYLPCFLEPRRRAERALLSVIQEAYGHGVSTRKVDDLVQALGLEGVSKSEVSRICQEPDEKMAPFRNRPLDGEYPYVWLDAKAVQPGAARAEGRAPGDFRCPRGPETGHRRGAARGRPGSGVGYTSCATCWVMSPSRPSPWWRRWSGRFSPSLTSRRPGSNSAGW